jgi:hypothetical protein
LKFAIAAGSNIIYHLKIKRDTQGRAAILALGHLISLLQLFPGNQIPVLLTLLPGKNLGNLPRTFSIMNRARRSPGEPNTNPQIAAPIWRLTYQLIPSAGPIPGIPYQETYFLPGSIQSFLF